MSVSVANGTTHAIKLVKAQDVDLHMTESGCAQMINGRNVQVQITKNNVRSNDNGQRLDNNNADVMVNLRYLYRSCVGNRALIQVLLAPDNVGFATLLCAT